MLKRGFFFLNWSTVDIKHYLTEVQCGDSQFLKVIVNLVIVKYWLHSPIVQSILVTYFVPHCISYSLARVWNLPASLSLLVTTSLFSVSLSLLLFCYIHYLLYFLDSTYMCCHTVLPFSVWLVSFGIMLSSCIPVAADGKVSFFYGWVALQWMCVPHLPCPFIGWWTRGLLSYLGNCK